MSRTKASADRFDLSEQVLRTWEAIGALASPAHSLRIIGKEIARLETLRSQDPQRTAALIRRYSAMAETLRSEGN